MKLPKNFSKTITAAYTLLGSMLVFGGLGYYLSTTYDNNVWFMSLLMLGAIIGMYELYKRINN
jgi:F0F1-type ATP synthase assembly protein I